MDNARSLNKETGWKGHAFAGLYLISGRLLPGRLCDRLECSRWVQKSDDQLHTLSKGEEWGHVSVRWREMSNGS